MIIKYNPLLAYLTKRLCGYIGLLTVLLTFLSLAIEFFEKLLRVTQATATQVMHFVCLLTIPTLCNLMPAIVMLALGLTLKDLVQRGEWDAMLLLGIVSRRLFAWLALSSLVLTGTMLIIKERYSQPLARKAQRINVMTLKKTVPMSVMSDAWFMVDEQTLCHCRALDIAQLVGHDCLIISLDQSFTTIKNIAPAKDLVFDKAIYLRLDAQLQVHQTAGVLYAIYLFTCPLLGLWLFMLAYWYSRLRWLLLLAPYPILMALAAIFSRC